jgi:hypothetical protein
MTRLREVMKGRSRPKRFVTGDLHFSRLGVCGVALE